MDKMATLIVIVVLVTATPGLGQEQTVERKVEQPVRQAVDRRQQTRREETAWQDERDNLLNLVGHLQKEQDESKARRTRLRVEKSAVEARIAAKTTQLERIDQIAAQIDPFLHELMARLRRLVVDDLPFLAVERQRRLANLERTLADSDASESERLRKLMEALMVELEYGQTIDVTRETIDLKGEAILVDVFRMGRLALFYQHLDGGACGFYNIAERKWQPLPDPYQGSILAAMEIGAKRRPVELLSLPIGGLISNNEKSDFLYADRLFVSVIGIRYAVPRPGYAQTADQSPAGAAGLGTQSRSRTEGGP